MIIYKATNLINGKVYIGQTIHTLEHRKKAHLNNAANGGKTHFYAAIRKYGQDNFLFEEICKADTIQQLNDLEVYYIQQYNSIENGYNMALGGDNNIMFSNIIKKHHKASLEKPEVRQKISKSLKLYRQQHPFSEEHRKHLSDSAKGNHNFGTGDTRSIACYCIDENNLEHHFHSYKEAGIWWFNNYKPFGEKYHQVTYQRKIIFCIENGFCYFGRNKAKLINNLLWYKERGDANEVS